MSTYTLQQQQKCINSLKIVSLYKVNFLKKLERAKISQFLSIYSLKCRTTKKYQVRPSSFTNFPCRLTYTYLLLVVQPSVYSA